LILPITAVSGLAEAVASFRPVCLVVAGSRASDEQVARWLREAVRQAGPLPVALYLQPGGAREPEHAYVLSTVPLEAQRQLLELMAAAEGAKSDASAAETNHFAQSV
jgi:hypothetical protein